MTGKPLVSIVIPAYESHVTLPGCMDALRDQTLQEFEVILIDSSPSDKCEQIIVGSYPWVKYEHVRQRMLPHEARNYGVSQSSAELIIFTDPDIYMSRSWFARLLETHRSHGGVVVGAVQCYGRSLEDVGIHLAKFDLVLPGGGVRSTTLAPTLNMLCPRSIYDALGGFPGEVMIGDTVFSWDLLEARCQITFDPEAVVVHHHTGTWAELVRERYVRGAEYSRVRAIRFGWTRRRIRLQILLSILPIRLPNLIARTLHACQRAEMIPQFILTLPIIATGHAAWLAGECLGLLRASSTLKR